MARCCAVWNALRVRSCRAFGDRQVLLDTPQRGARIAPYGQARGVMPLSCAYLAATSGRTSTWSSLIQSVSTVYCFPSHC
jgi:hypothetical protein